ncbi:KOW domain-containing protein [Nemania diffusa]|nr:KOW domain-containing protein [Nemania diffusa]
MQKILRRVATVERVASKRAKIKIDKSKRRERKSGDENSRQNLQAVRDDIERAKQAVRDDWAMGALSPRLDVGPWHGAHGAISEHRAAKPGRFPPEKLDARCKWAGGAKYLNLVEGDRVVLLDGPEKGRIGEIMHIQRDSAEITVKDLNKSNIRLAEYTVIEENGARTTTLEIPLPISAVRLVHPITDPATGITRDVIINQLAHRDLITDRLTGKRTWKRVVPGLNISIPWPEKPEQEPPTHKVDTRRIDVENKTFVPTLLRPPMPESVIDELRGRYSRFRTRHEPEYVARLEAEDQAKKDRVKLMESMRTPLQELHRAEREKKKKKGKPRLTLEMLEKIGEVIAKNRERSLNAAGVSDVPPLADVPPPASSNAEPTPPPPST